MPGAAYCPAAVLLLPRPPRLSLEVLGGRASQFLSSAYLNAVRCLRRSNTARDLLTVVSESYPNPFRGSAAMLPTKKADTWEPISRVDTSPMAGVVLVLLMIAMVMTPSMTGESVLPRAATAAPVEEDRVTIGIDSHGRYWIEGVPDPGPVPVDQLPARVQQAYAILSPRDSVLNLKADRQVPYAAILSLLDAAKALGIHRVDAIADLPLKRPAKP